MLSEEKHKEKYHENIQIYKQKLEVWVKNKMKKKLIWGEKKMETVLFFANSDCVSKFKHGSRHTLCDKGTSFLPSLNFYQGMQTYIWCRELKEKLKLHNCFEIWMNCWQVIKQQCKPCKIIILIFPIRCMMAIDPVVKCVLKKVDFQKIKNLKKKLNI